MMTGTLARVLVVHMQNAISHAQFNVLGRIIAMSTSTADLVGTCACAQEVQFKWILVADLGFFGNVSCYMSTPVSFEMHLSRRAWALLRQVKTNSLFFLTGCLSQIEMGLSTFIKFLPHSKRLI
jgi:hypothetical protein